jgi:interleukin-1 receptor-associated kinase 1
MTAKADVYIFGILLLEIVSGRNNAEYREKEETVVLLDTVRAGLLFYLIHFS